MEKNLRQIGKHTCVVSLILALLLGINPAILGQKAQAAPTFDFTSYMDYRNLINFNAALTKLENLDNDALIPILRQLKTNEARESYFNKDWNEGKTDLDLRNEMIAATKDFRNLYYDPELFINDHRDTFYSLFPETVDRVDFDYLIDTAPLAIGAVFLKNREEIKAKLDKSEADILSVLVPFARQGWGHIKPTSGSADFVNGLNEIKWTDELLEETALSIAALCDPDQKAQLALIYSIVRYTMVPTGDTFDNCFTEEISREDFTGRIISGKLNLPGASSTDLDIIMRVAGADVTDKGLWFSSDTSVIAPDPANPHLLKAVGSGNARVTFYRNNTVAPASVTPVKDWLYVFEVHVD